MDEYYKEPNPPLKKYLDQVTDDAVSKIIEPLSGPEIMQEIAEMERYETRQMYLDARAPEEHFSEIRELVDEKMLGILMAELELIDTESSIDAFDYVRLAAEIKELDPEWFAKNYRENYKRQNNLTSSIYIIKKDPLRFLEYLNNFKTFNPEYYKKEKSLVIEDEMWDQIAEQIKEEGKNNHLDEFIINYAKAAYLDYGEISKRVRIEDYWPAFLEKLKSFAKNPSDCARIVAAGQTIRPNEADKVIFIKKDWQVCKKELGGTSFNYKKEGKLTTLRYLAWKIRAIKYLEVES